jgi:hypothetical protein
MTVPPVFWVVASCTLVEVYRHFGGACCFNHQGVALMSANFYQTTRRNNPEVSHLHTRRLKNLKSHKILSQDSQYHGRYSSCVPPPLNLILGWWIRKGCYFTYRCNCNILQQKRIILRLTFFLVIRSRRVRETGHVARMG